MDAVLIRRSSSLFPLLFSLGSQPTFRVDLLSSVNCLETLRVTPKCTSQGESYLVKLTMKMSLTLDICKVFESLNMLIRVKSKSTYD